MTLQEEAAHFPQGSSPTSANRHGRLHEFCTESISKSGSLITSQSMDQICVGATSVFNLILSTGLPNIPASCDCAEANLRAGNDSQLYSASVMLIN